MEKEIKKVLLLGSGALKIGEAGEFDYSGSQAIKAFKEEGIQVVLINPNIATIQTSEGFADKVYFLPVTPYFVEQIIKKEKPDAISISFGGQTALNCGLELQDKGVFEDNSVQILGTPVQTVLISEDRDLFAKHLKSIGIPTPQSKPAVTVEEARQVAAEIGYPLMIRAAFALGGQKSGLVENEQELVLKVEEALAFAPQVLVEKYLKHYKEIEYEVVRDWQDNCICVCNMENFDPLGIHTGESIVIAPSQTLTNFEYQTLRSAAIKIVRSLGVVGECNVQFALNPNPNVSSKSKILNETKTQNNNLVQPEVIDYQVIEMNARLSRSSALASKATGYPLAYVAAKLALGKTLLDVQNQITKVTQSAFEPALDYVVVKIPRWDLEKFDKVDETIGSAMKSVGEVMAIGRSFEEALQKGLRSLEIGVSGITDAKFQDSSWRTEFGEKGTHMGKTGLLHPTPKRAFRVAQAIESGMSVQEIYSTCGIDPWFLYRIKNIIVTEKQLISQKTLFMETLNEQKNINRLSESQDKNELLAKGEKLMDLLTQVKQVGISDKRISELMGVAENEVRELRKALNVTPSIFQIDTLAGEFPAQTNYLYTTYHGAHHDVVPIGKEGVLVLGAGPYRIGCSVEFDWTAVQTARGVSEFGRKSIIINCNPETVSTDYDMSDRLYFEELSFERIADIYDFELSEGAIVSVGGQTPNNLVEPLEAYGVPILGTSAKNIDMAEDRGKFSALCDELDIRQPAWQSLAAAGDASEFAGKIGYPVLLRPSYVLSGAAMAVCYNEAELENFLSRALEVSDTHPVTVSKFMENAKEIEFDAVAKDGKIVSYGVSEHVEQAGVHSGDASVVYPPQNIYTVTYAKIIRIAQKLSTALSITGPFNIQFLASEHEVYVIELNLRASRTFPFISKATGVNLATKIADALFAESVEKKDIKESQNGAGDVHWRDPGYVVVKVPQFSFSRLQGADPQLRVEMASTGEAAAFGRTLPEAFLKASIAVGAKIPKVGVYISLGALANKVHLLGKISYIRKLNVPIYATEKTRVFLAEHGVNTTLVHKIQESREPSVLTLFAEKKVDLAVNITDPHLFRDNQDHYRIRRAAIDNNIHLITNRHTAELFFEAISKLTESELEPLSWSEYTK